MTAAELSDLDLAVARAEDLKGARINCSGRVIYLTNPEYFDWTRYSPTRRRDQAMRLLQKYQLALMPAAPGWKGWICYRPSDPLNDLTAQIFGEGAETPSIAICRAVVALKEPL